MSAEYGLNDNSGFARWRHAVFVIFIYYLFSIALTSNFLSYILFLYCSYTIWRLTHCVKILLLLFVAFSVTQNTSI